MQEYFADEKVADWSVLYKTFRRTYNTFQTFFFLLFLFRETDRPDYIGSSESSTIVRILLATGVIFFIYLLLNIYNEFKILICSLFNY